MSKRKSPVKPVRAPAVVGIDRPERVKSKTPKPASGRKGIGLSRAAFRETVESVVIAFVLAFLFRTFEAEAFVIPTGSMATDAHGPPQGLGVSGLRLSVPGQRQRRDQPGRQPDDAARPSRNAPARCVGGPIIVMRSRGVSFRSRAIAFWSASSRTSSAIRDRWDVAVFHYPGEAQTNYIKRVVGLPRRDGPRPPGRRVHQRTGRGGLHDRAQARQEAPGDAAAGLRQRPDAPHQGQGVSGALVRLAVARRQCSRRLATGRRRLRIRDRRVPPRNVGSAIGIASPRHSNGTA